MLRYLPWLLGVLSDEDFLVSDSQLKGIQTVCVSVKSVFGYVKDECSEAKGL